MNMKRKMILLAGVLLALAPGLFADVILEVDPLAQVRLVGQQATVTIESSLGFVGDFDLNISWNPAVVALFDIDYGTQLGGPADSIQNPFGLGAGTVNASEISLLSPGDLMALQPGPGATLLTLVFNAIAPGVSPVNIGVVSIGDEVGLAHTLVDINPGSITVTGTGIIPEPSSFLLLGSAAGLLFWRMGKARG
jgi:hypothetical protein